MRTIILLHFIFNSIVQFSYNNIYRINVTKAGVSTPLEYFLWGYILHGPLLISVWGRSRFGVEWMSEISEHQIINFLAACTIQFSQSRNALMHNILYIITSRVYVPATAYFCFTFSMLLLTKEWIWMSALRLCVWKYSVRTLCGESLNKLTWRAKFTSYGTFTVMKETLHTYRSTFW